MSKKKRDLLVDESLKQYPKKWKEQTERGLLHSGTWAGELACGARARVVRLVGPTTETVTCVRCVARILGESDVLWKQ